MICKHCGTQNPDTTRICTQCGMPLEENTEQNPVKQEETKNKTNPQSSIPEDQLELDKEIIGKNTRGLRNFWKKRS